MATNRFRLAKNFMLSEFEDPTTKEVKLDTNLVRLLQRLRDGINRPVYVLSGYRTPEHNRAVGGAKHSYHLRGQAADIKTISMSIPDLAKRADRLGFGGIGIYKTHLHVDTGPKRRW